MKMAFSTVATPFAIFVAFYIATASGDISGWATCDNKMWLYADGVLKVQSDDWAQASQVTLPDNTRVVAIKCVDLHVVAGIRASFDNGVTTDGTWKCNTSPTPGWQKAGFNDASWVSATEIPESVRITYWQNRPGELRSAGPWIWTSGYRGQQKVVYCRKEFPETKDCCCNMTIELNLLKQEFTKQLTTIKNELSRKMNQVISSSQSSNQRVINSLKELTNTVNNTCNSNCGQEIFIPIGCHCPAGRPTGRHPPGGMPGASGSNLPPCPPGCAREPKGPETDLIGVPGGRKLST